MKITSKTSKMSIAEKRNYGANLASTPYLAFIDSDAIPIQGWPENGLPFLELEEDHVGIVTGPNLPFPKQNVQQKLVYLANLSFLVSGANYYEKTDSFEGFVTKASSCNLLISKELYQKVGGMDPQLKVSEDLDLSSKVIDLGRKIYFSRKLKIYHRNRMFKGLIKQRITYGFSDVLLAKKTKRYWGGLLPFVFQFSLFVGLLLALFLHWVFIPIISVTALYIFFILYESFRLGWTWSERVMLIPYIFVGNFFPGIGTWCYLLMPHYDIYNIYNNDE